MKRKLFIAAVALLLLSRCAFAHRLDEYLQASMLTIAKDHVGISMRLVPGVSVAAAIVAGIDRDGDGVISQAEQQAYAESVIANLALSIDGTPLKAELVSDEFPPIAQMREGMGEIHLELSAALPAGGANRRLVLENRTQFAKAGYLVNTLVPADRDIQIVGQKRNEQQSYYELDYVQDGALWDSATTSTAASKATLNWWSAVSAQVSAAGFGKMFQIGLRHIAEGTDHLLFLLALLLPAPLLAAGSRWSGVANVRGSVVRILKIVTAFTIGHSITLALAAWGVVRVPSRPIEVLIAVSILVSAIHALRPIFPGKEAWIAGFFGLIHGLAFAATLNELGLSRWERVTGVLAFNLGIETMQMIVVAATMPSLLLLSRTRGYAALRVGGAIFAGAAATGWIVERLMGIESSVDLLVNAVAHQAVWIAAALFAASLGCWLVTRGVPDRAASMAVD